MAANVLDDSDVIEIDADDTNSDHSDETYVIESDGSVDLIDDLTVGNDPILLEEFHDFITSVANPDEGDPRLQADVAQGGATNRPVASTSGGAQRIDFTNVRDGLFRQANLAQDANRLHASTGGFQTIDFSNLGEDPPGQASVAPGGAANLPHAPTPGGRLQRLYDDLRERRARHTAHIPRPRSPRAGASSGAQVAFENVHLQNDLISQHATIETRFMDIISGLSTRIPPPLPTLTLPLGVPTAPSVANAPTAAAPPVANAPTAAAPPVANAPTDAASPLSSASRSPSPQPGPSTEVPNPGPPATGPALDQSLDEFKSPPRKRAKPSTSTSKSPAKSAEPSSVDDDDGQCCPICFDEWTNSGSHRLCCLKCGHVFGHSCIDRWLRDKKQKGLCPQCNKPAKLKDIRFIFAKNLKVTDTSERDAALKSLDAQKEQTAKAEMEVARMRMVSQRANEDCNILRQENVQLRQQLQQLRSQAGANNLSRGTSDITPSQSTSHSTGGYNFERLIKISDAGNCRVMAYSSQCATLVVSQPSTSHLFPGFGVRKVSVMDFKTNQYVPIHSKMIRDVCFNLEGCMLSAGMDKNVKITSINSSTIVQSYTCPTPVWSCCWSEDDRFSFFAGLANGKVRCYDIRNTAEHVKEFNDSGPPVVSLEYVKTDPHARFRPGGVLASQLACSKFFEKKDEEFLPHVLPVEGNLMYMSLEDRSRHILATYRPNNRCPTVKHEMFELSCSNISADPSVIQNSCTGHSIQTFTAGRECKALSRTCLLRHPGAEDKLLACAGDEATKSLHIWDTQTGKLAQRIPCLADVMDLCSVTINDDYYLAALTDKNLRLHKWTS